MEKAEIFQIIYISDEAVAFNPEDLRALLTKARQNNMGLGIGGLLIYEKGSFLQILEGPEEKVMALLEKIGKDPRHCELKTLSKKYVEEPQFSHWEMGFINADNESTLPEGYIDYQKGFSNKMVDDTLATKALEAFLEGNWRTNVEAA